MNFNRLPVALLSVWICCSQCGIKDVLGFEELPSPLDTSVVQVYVNGKLEAYIPQFYYYTGAGISCDFFQKVNNGTTNVFGLGPIPLSVDTVNHGKYLVFAQYRHLDHGRKTYNQIEKDSALFRITAIDTTAKRIKGVFKAKFKRRTPGILTVSIGVASAHLPDILSIEGTFNTNYTAY
jgi:hypothetical protein